MKFKKAILKSLENNYCRLKPSKIEGIGVVAIRDIPKNTRLFVGATKRCWFKFKLKDLKNLDPETQRMVKGFFAAGQDGGYWICNGGLNSIDISFYLNHSSRPNVRIIGDGSNFVTARKIKKGEELTVSYSTFDARFEANAI